MEVNQTIDNMQKYENYKTQMSRLKKAIKEEFYLEAIFIEYAVIEDRLESILVHSGNFNPKRHNKIEKKLSKIEEMTREKKGLLRNYISDELIESIYEWKNKRNIFIHSLMKQQTTTHELQEIAVSGMDIIKVLNNKSTSYKRKLFRLNESQVKK
ncbi:MAG: hypothetical protein ACI4JM_00305 [Oscillospiraceae bacterium]